MPEHSTQAVSFEAVNFTTTNSTAKPMVTAALDTDLETVHRRLKNSLFTPSYSSSRQPRPRSLLKNATSAILSVVEPSIVKIMMRGVVYNPMQAWQAPHMISAIGSGFVVNTAKGLRIITNAHVVYGHVKVQVRLSLDEKWYDAVVELEGHECDLAMLTVQDNTFWQQAKPIEMGEMPAINQKLNILGFPMGGSEISVTEGVVSRYGFQSYAYGGAELLTIQIDAPMNHGNSGGAAIVNNKLVGVPHQKSLFGEALGYMIPVTVLKHFLKDAETDNYRGIPQSPFLLSDFQQLPTAVRSYHGMRADQTGILLNCIKPGTKAALVLEKNDILLSIDGYPVRNDGTVLWNDRPVKCIQVIQLHYVGDKIPLKILRNHQEKDVELELEEGLHQKVKKRMKEDGGAPSYYICSGLVFQELTWNYWSSLSMHVGQFQLPLLWSLAISSLDINKTPIILGRALPTAITEGYEGLFGSVIQKINGQDINSLKDVIKACEKNAEDFHTILLESQKEIWIPNIKDPAVHQEILDKYKIPCDRSKDLSPLTRPLRARF